MSYAKKDYRRSLSEKIFLPLFLVTTVLGYLTLKYPELLISIEIIKSAGDLYFLGKSPSFWYMLVYTLIVCGISLKVLFAGKNMYGKGKQSQKPLSQYQKIKFTSIFLSQLIFFFRYPFHTSPSFRRQAFF